MSDKLSILIAEDHKVVRAGLTMLINREPDMSVVGEADNGEQAVQKALELKPDLVVMDLSMPGINGLQATKSIKSALPEVKVLVLTMHAEEIYLRRAREAKAGGYLLKGSAGRDLVRAIRLVAAGECYFENLEAPELAPPVLAEFLDSNKSDSPGLSAREQMVLRGIASGFGNQELATRLGLSVKTIETYKARISAKLGVNSRAETVRYALSRGWLTEGDWAPPLAS